MIEFILLTTEDKKIKTIIEKVLIQKDYEYSINNKIKDLSNNKFMIYIIETTKENEKKIMDIRKKDWSSMIIVITDNKRKIKELLEKRLLLVDIILKDQEFEKYLTRAIKISINNYEQRPNTLKYEYKKVYYQIPYNKIKIIEKCKEDKKCRIITEEKEYYIPYHLKEIEKLLPKDFIKVNRSTLINKNEILFYNSKENKIIFLDETEYYEISRGQKKEVINQLRKVE